MSELPRIDGVPPMSAEDRAAIDEVRDVLAKHGALQRFGVTLLHSHFDVAEDEILVETVDAQARTLTIRPVMAKEAMSAGEPVATSWRLDSPDGEPRSLVQCFRAPGGTNHTT